MASNDCIHCGERMFTIRVCASNACKDGTLDPASRTVSKYPYWRSLFRFVVLNKDLRGVVAWFLSIPFFLGFFVISFRGVAGILKLNVTEDGSVGILIASGFLTFFCSIILGINVSIATYSGEE